MPIKVLNPKQVLKYKSRAVSKPVKQSIKKTLNRMLNRRTEKKRYVFGITGSVTATGSVTELTSLIEKGLAAYNREGEDCYLSSVYIKYRLLPGDNNNFFRCMLIATSENFSAPSGSADLFLSENSGTSALYLNSFVDTHKYKVLYDKFHYVNYQDGSEDILGKIVHNKFSKISIKKKLMYNADTGTADKYRLYWVIFSDSGEVPNPAINGQILLNFKDSI